jgi:peptidase E
MKNYLFSGNINKEAQKLLKQDLVNAKVLVGIAAGDDSAISDMYFYEGTEKYPSTVSIFEEISSIETFKLLDKRITGNLAQEILKTADVVYLTGGNPYIQLKYIKDNGLETILQSFKGIIVGVSAGSMNQGKIAYYCKDEHYPETKTYEALDLVDVTIDPHYDVLNEEQVFENKKWSEQIPIIGLPNDSFVVVDNGEIIIYGENYQHYIHRKHK